MQSSSSARRGVLFAVVLGGMVAISSPVAAAPGPTSFGMVVTATDRCRVSLVAVSYDDPGADDAEFMELQVDGLPGADLGVSSPAGGEGAASSDAGSCHGPMPASDADAATSLDASVVDAAVSASPRLGDCGLEELRLVDGNGGSCEEYRTIPLADVPVPKDGYVVLCPAGSGVDARARCDVTAAGRSALRGGWLQNGPNDGLRFVGTGGSVALQISYEGALACFGKDAPSLAAESGELGGPGVDDVNALCYGRFVLLPDEDVTLRGPVRCPLRPAPDAAFPIDGAADPGAVPVADGAAPWVPERAPASPATVTPHTPTTVLFDAGAVVPSKPQGTFPSPPGCAVEGAGRPRTAAPLLGLLAFGLFRRRTRRTPAASPALRAVRGRCGVRYGSGPRRSPSR